jgi:hypothetical protein
MEKTMTLTVDAISEGTALRSLLLSKKHVIVEALATNTSRVYVAASYITTGGGRRSTDFDILDPSEVKFYSAPKDKLIHYLWFYCDVATQYISIKASDGSLNRLRSIDIEKQYSYDHVESLVLDCGAGDASKTGYITPSASESVLVLGFTIHADVWTSGDKITVYHEDSSFNVLHKPVVNYYLAAEKKPHSIMLKRPLLVAKTEVVFFEWAGTASAKKVSCMLIEKRKTAVT